MGGPPPCPGSGHLSRIVLTAVNKCLDACQDGGVIPAARARRPPADRYDERRNELAESALLTLGELGYARTSLRDIASNSPFSHGVLHYYFADKLELVIYSVTYYKMRCITRYDEVIAELDDRAGAARRVRRQAGRDDRRRHADAPALVRPARREHVRRPAARGSAQDRRRPAGHDLADRDPLLRAGRPAGGDGPALGVRRARRAVPGRASSATSPATRPRCPRSSARCMR